jgi:hypothetical protein
MSRGRWSIEDGTTVVALKGIDVCRMARMEQNEWSFRFTNRMRLFDQKNTGLPNVQKAHGGNTSDFHCVQSGSIWLVKGVWKTCRNMYRTLKLGRTRTLHDCLLDLATMALSMSGKVSFDNIQIETTVPSKSHSRSSIHSMQLHVSCRVVERHTRREEVSV